MFEDKTLPMSYNRDILLHPELLPDDMLITIIKERHVKIHNLEHLPRENLLEIFHQYCVPYAQRKYRDTGRGKLLNKARDISEESVEKVSNIINNNINSLEKFNCAKSDRLKPPLEIIEHKRIKLNETIDSTLLNGFSSNSQTMVNCVKRKIVSDTNCVPTPEKKRRVMITWP